MIFIKDLDELDYGFNKKYFQSIGLGIEVAFWFWIDLFYEEVVAVLFAFLYTAFKLIAGVLKVAVWPFTFIVLGLMGLLRIKGDTHESDYDQ